MSMPESTMTEQQPRRFVRPLLWLLLVVCAAGNVVTQAAHVLLAGVGFGVAVIGLSVALVVHHHRNRRR